MITRLHQLLEGRLAGLGLSPVALLDRDAPGGLAHLGSVSANGSCRFLQCRDGWIALNLARSDDRDLVPALTGRDGASWDALACFAADSAARNVAARAIELHMPVAIPGESAPQDLAPLDIARVPGRVIDLSALWAGPLCAGLLARAGAQVTRVDSLGRPDPTAAASPLLDARINGGKARVPLDLRTEDGRAALHRLIATADVLVTSARPAALARLGLEPVRFPDLTWVAITAHGFVGPGAARVGFGDDCAVAGGLVRWDRGSPRFVGDALADPLTGLEAARAVLSGRRGVIDIAMARVAAAYAGHPG